MATLTEQLAEAQAAYHDMRIGKGIASVRDQNGEEIRYSKSDPNGLLAYIADLQELIAAAAGNPTKVIGPMRPRFG